MPCLKRWRPSLLGWWRTAWSQGTGFRPCATPRIHADLLGHGGIGATVVGMNAWRSHPEMRDGARDSEPKFLFLDERYTRIKDEPELPGNPTLSPCASRPRRAPAYETLRDHGGSLPEVTIDPDSDACILHLGTRNPKGTLQTHRAADERG